MKRLEMIEWKNTYYNLNNIVSIEDCVVGEELEDDRININFVDCNYIQLTLPEFRKFQDKYLDIKIMR
jgi:hypothetical protein